MIWLNMKRYTYSTHTKHNLCNYTGVTVVPKCSGKYVCVHLFVTRYTKLDSLWWCFYSLSSFRQNYSKMWTLTTYQTEIVVRQVRFHWKASNFKCLDRFSVHELDKYPWTVHVNVNAELSIINILIPSSIHDTHDRIKYNMVILKGLP